jgi:ABC-2 type transport system ATP-binding protein
VSAVSEASGVELRAVGLHKRFSIRGRLPGRPRRHVDALAGVDLDVGRSAIHGLVGPNGSGKSTLLRIFATLILPASGRATIGDIDVVADASSARRAVGFSTGEERSLYWRLTARQNLEFYAALYHLPRRSPALDTALERADLLAEADRPVSTFSQGMARRLGLARALLHEPPVLVLDEPTRSLDPESRDRFHHVLNDLRDRRGTTVLLATHDLSEAARLCDRVTILRSGVVAGELTPVDEESLAAAFHDAVGVTP